MGLDLGCNRRISGFFLLWRDHLANFDAPGGFTPADFASPSHDDGVLPLTELVPSHCAPSAKGELVAQEERVKSGDHRFFSKADFFIPGRSSPGSYGKHVPVGTGNKFQPDSG